MNPSRKLDLVSVYLNQPMMKAHMISLHLQSGAEGNLEGRMQLDPNECHLNVWGDRTTCTRMGFQSHEVKATMMRTLDTLHLGRVHWALRVEGVSGSWHLIEHARAGLWYLVHDTGTEQRSVIPLFPAEMFTQDAVGTVQTRYGIALREVAARGDVNEMRAEAETVRRALAGLDAGASSRAEGRSVGADKVSEVRAALTELEDALRRLER